MVSSHLEAASGAALSPPPVPDVAWDQPADGVVQPSVELDPIAEKRSGERRTPDPDKESSASHIFRVLNNTSAFSQVRRNLLAKDRRHSQPEPLPVSVLQRSLSQQLDSLQLLEPSPSVEPRGTVIQKTPTGTPLTSPGPRTSSPNPSYCENSTASVLHNPEAEGVQEVGDNNVFEESEDVEQEKGESVKCDHLPLLNSDVTPFVGEDISLISSHLETEAALLNPQLQFSGETRTAPPGLPAPGIRCSVLQGESTRSQSVAASSVSPLQVQITMTDADQQVLLCGRLCRSVRVKMGHYPLSMMTGPDHAARLQEMIPEVCEAFERFAAEVGILLDETDASEDVMDRWQTTLDSVQEEVARYQTEGLTRCRGRAENGMPGFNVSAGSSASATEVERLELEKARDAKREKVARATVGTLYSQILESNVALSRSCCEHYGTLEEWEDAADERAVEDAVGKLDRWRQEVGKMQGKVSQLEATVAGEDLEDQRYKVVEAKRVVAEADQDIYKLTKTIKSLNLELGICAGMKVKTIPIVMDTFGGTDGEDLEIFRKNTEDAFCRNQIPVSDRVRQLRSCLKGRALARVPESTRSIEKAWSSLKEAFGDVAQLMEHRKAKLSKLGRFGDKPKEKVEWCLSLVRIMEEMMDLASRERKMEYEIYSNSGIRLIMNILPEHMRRKVHGFTSEMKDLYLDIMELVDKERALQQREVLFAPENARVRSAGVGGFGGGGSGKVVSGATRNPSGFTVFQRGPRKMPECRICQRLEQRGDNRNLYDDHVNNYATGCPRFAGLTNEERATIAREAKFCLSCFDPKVIFKGRGPAGHECSVTRDRKNRFSCLEPNCTWHSWVCCSHKDTNRGKLEKFVEECQRKGMAFCFLSNLGVALTSSSEQLVESVETGSSGGISGQSSSTSNQSASPLPTLSNWQGGRVATTSTRDEESGDFSPLLVSSESGTVSPALSTPSAEQAGVLTAAAAAEETMPSPGVGYKLGVVKIKKLTPCGEALDTDFRGEPLFLFSGIEGKSRELNAFWDSGNSHTLFKHDIMDELINVKVRTGPFTWEE